MIPPSPGPALIMLNHLWYQQKGSNIVRDSGVGKMEQLVSWLSPSHYYLYLALFKSLCTASIDDHFNDSWKVHAENHVTAYGHGEMSSAQDRVLDRIARYAQVFGKLKE